MRKKKCSAACRAEFEAVLSRIEHHASVQFRHVKCPGNRDEMVAETLALSWKWWVSLWDRGKEPRRFVSALATFALKAARSGRRICGQEKAKDVMSSRAQTVKGFLLVSLPAFSTLSGNPIAEALISNTVTPVDEQVAFRMDFPAWLASLDVHRRQIVQLLLAGERTIDIAEKVGKSAARISQLRVEFCLSWNLFVSEQE